MLDKILNSSMKKYIYGAGDVAMEVFFCLSKAPYHIPIEAFIVSDLSCAEMSEKNGIPVIPCKMIQSLEDSIVIVAVLEKYRDEICMQLDKLHNIHRVLLTFESDLWSAVRDRFFKSNFRENTGITYLDLEKICIKNKIKRGDFPFVYVVKSLKDKAIFNDYETREWEQEILAGAALASADMNSLTDATGDNISYKNSQYCELTVLYWLWKNTYSEYIGLSHYRRRFIFSDDDLDKIYSGEIDALLTVPIVNVPSVRVMYNKNHVKDDWDVMGEGINRLYPEYNSSLEKVSCGNYYIPYNMFVMKRDVLNDYCSWLFNLLDYCENRIGKKNDTYQNRYIGFLAERLMTVYFYHHREKLNIFFCNKHFLE